MMTMEMAKLLGYKVNCGEARTEIDLSARLSAVEAVVREGRPTGRIA